jgi:ADP-ribose pyrophosphatase YjhB (NUDIX family)
VEPARGRARPARLARLARAPVDWSRTALGGLVGRRRAPRAVVQAVVLSERRVLLCVRAELRGWELPGGAPEPGESDAEALVREVREETGVEIRVERRTGEYHRTGFLPHVARVYRCRAVGGAPAPSAETPRVAWIDPRALPDTLFPWYRGPLADALAGCDAPVVRHEVQGPRAVAAGMWIDLRMRWSDDAAR